MAIKTKPKTNSETEAPKGPDVLASDYCAQRFDDGETLLPETDDLEPLASETIDAGRECVKVERSFRGQLRSRLAAAKPMIDGAAEQARRGFTTVPMGTRPDLMQDAVSRDVRLAAEKGERERLSAEVRDWGTSTGQAFAEATDTLGTEIQRRITAATSPLSTGPTTMEARVDYDRLGETLKRMTLRKIVGEYEAALVSDRGGLARRIEDVGTLILTDILAAGQVKRAQWLEAVFPDSAKRPSAADEMAMCRAMLARFDAARGERIPESVLAAARICEICREVLQFLVAVDPRQMSSAQFRTSYINTNAGSVVGPARYTPAPDWWTRFANPQVALRVPGAPRG